MSRTPPDAELAYQRLRDAIKADVVPGRMPRMIGILSGGAWVAERLHADLNLTDPIGFLSSTFHRDDFGQRGLPGGQKSTALPFEVDGADILLVDDILYTGRTVRAALNELFDYGRPERVRLAVLLDRGGRQLPIAADFTGVAYPLSAPESFALSRADDGRFHLAIKSA